MFLQQEEQVVPWAALVKAIAPIYPEGKPSWPPFSLETVPHIQFIRLWFTLSGSTIEGPSLTHQFTGSLHN